ncbi:ABC transporter permease [Candidatus Aminicenantes bacterium AC-708-M15]|nr:ABC transporter permease [SCandidatus Aminicenantes bacterium Aminicenantia_JdfR_composite]MCP2604244.1 ABC transporter permease [Candidatus Aminicenantes bacterium AC-708-M15]
MFSTIIHIVRKEFIQTFRDKRMLMPIFIAPIIQLILFGYAVTTDVKNISIGILDFDQTQQSRELITKFSITEYFNLSHQVFSYNDVEYLLQKGEVKSFIIIPPEFGKNIKKMKKTSLQVIIDATDANSANIIMSYISKLIGEYSKKILINVENWEFGNIILAPRIWYNPELKSAVYMVPGVICLILLITTIILTSLAITKEKEMGTIEQLIVSPIKTWELILGKTIPFVIIGFCDIILIVLAGKLVFDVPVRGSLLFLFGASFIFILTTLSIGLFISTISRTQQQAMMTAFFFIVPAMLLSGIFSPIENMPKIIQYITYFNPLRYFVKLVRGILLKGNNLSILWPEVLILSIFGIVAIVLSSLRFRKHIE